MSFQTEEVCSACRERTLQRTFHHVLTRKSRPDLIEEKKNKMPLCLKCHNMIHAKGTTYMSNKFLGVRIWLEKNGWYFCEVRNKWTIDI